MTAALRTLPPPVAKPVPIWKRRWKSAVVIALVAVAFAILRPSGDDVRTRALLSLDQPGVELSMTSGNLGSVAFKLKPGIEGKQSNLGWAFHQLGRFPETKRVDTVHFLPTSVPTLKELKSLISFRVQERTDLKDADFEAFAGMSNLETLEIQGDKLTPEALQHLEGLNKLKTLKIGGVKLLGAGFERVCRIPNLEYLGIERGSSKRDVPLRFEPGSRLKILRLADIDLTEKMVQGLEHLRTLEEVYLWQVSFDEAFFRSLKRLPRLKVLKVLHGGTPFEVGVDQVAAFPALESLSLQNYSGTEESRWFTVEGMRRLAKSTTIKHLELFGTWLGDAGVRELSAMSGLKTLRLNQVGATEACFDDLKKLRSLESLSIYEPRWEKRRGISPEAFARFQKEIKLLNKTEADNNRFWGGSW